MGNTILTSVAISETVETIESEAFMDCINLTRVTIPDGVTGIESFAFSGCKKLPNVTISSTVTTIEEDAFALCTMLENINVNTANQNYSSLNGVLFNKLQTKLVTYPEGKTGDYSIPASVETIGDSAFSTCTGLNSITISNSVTTIGEAAFHACTGLTTIDIPESVTTLGDSAFLDCSGLTAIGVHASNVNFSSSGGVLFNKEKTELIACPGGKTGAYSIPAGVTTLGIGAFAACKKITTVTIPTSVTTIENRVFLNCKNLTSVNILASVTELPYEIFYGCSRLTSITIPDSVATIEAEAFYGCTGLTDFTIPDSVTGILYSAFHGCTGLTRVTIPDSVTTIETYAFYHCGNLGAANFLGNAPDTFGTDVFTDCAADFTITYLSGKTGFTTPAWNGYPSVMLYIVTFQTDGTAGATLNGSTTQQVMPGEDTTPVEAVAPTGYRLTGWTASNGATYSDNPLKIKNITTNLTLTADFVKDGKSAISSVILPLLLSDNE